MHVERVSDLAAFESLRPSWNSLADGVPFRQWEWISNWWSTYSAGRDLYVLVARDHERKVVGIAPFYRECTLAGGRVIQFMGNGKVCSDYQSLLVQPADIQQVGLAFARFMAAASAMKDHGWDQCELEAVPEQDLVIPEMTRRMADLGVASAVRQGEPSWCVDLPSDWDQVLAGMKSNLRRKLKSLHRKYLDTERAVFRVAETEQQVEQFYDFLVDLHQRRWHDAGKAGCFDHFGFERFLLQVVRDFAQNGKLFFCRLEIDGDVAVTSCLLRGESRFYVYQCGIDPQHWEHQPGWLINMMILRTLIDRGVKECDFLRGEERYKRELSAQPIPHVNVRYAAPHTRGRLHHQLWSTQDTIKTWGHQVVSAIRG